MKNAYILNLSKAKLKDYHYNYTLLGLPQYDDLLPPNEADHDDYYLHHPITFFTDEKHGELLILFNYVLLPEIIQKNNGMKKGIQTIRKNFSHALVILIILYCSVIVLGYLLVWRRLQNNMNDTIYKTKSMLNIIPQDVLIHLRSIQKIFGLNTNIKPDT